MKIQLKGNSIEIRVAYLKESTLTFRITPTDIGKLVATIPDHQIDEFVRSLETEMDTSYRWRKRQGVFTKLWDTLNLKRKLERKNERD